MTEKKKKSKSTTKKAKKSGSKKKATSTMAACAKAWNKSDKKGKYTSFVKKYFKDHY
jgi:hypothetical protein